MPDLLAQGHLDEAPILTVVIASVNGWDVLCSTLDALDDLPERARTEVIVVETLGGTMAVSSPPGCGTSLLVEIPVEVQRGAVAVAIRARGAPVASACGCRS